MVPKITQKPPNFKRLLVPKRAHLHWAQDQGAGSDKNKDIDCTPIGALALPHFRSSQGPLQKNQARGEEGVLRTLYLEKEKKFALPLLCCRDILRGIIFKRAAR